PPSVARGLQEVVAGLAKTGSPEARNPGKQARRRRRRRTVKGTGNPNQPFAVTAGAALTRVPALRGTLAMSEPISPSSVGWLETNLDPCGEYKSTLDYGKVPDGAIPMSVCGQFRETFTIRHPGANPMVAPLDGTMWTLGIIRTNLWRTPFLLIADMRNAEISDSSLDEVARSFNNYVGEIELASHPNWVETLQEGLYWSIQRWTALIGVPPPSDTGVSPYITDFRMTGSGFTVSSNTPSLINQGMVVVAQFNPNTENKEIVPHSESGETPMGWSRVYSLSTSQIVTTYIQPGVGGAQNTFTVIANRGPAVINSSVLPAVTQGYRFLNGDTYAVGDSLRYQFTERDSGGYTVYLQRSTDGTTFTNIGPPSTTTAAPSGTSTASGVGFILEGDVLAGRVNMLTLPPFTQSDLMQQTPKTCVFQIKEGGFYVRQDVWQPVYNMTPASRYAPVRFVSGAITLDSLNSSVGTIRDTADSNYGFALCHMTSIPLACAPFIKAEMRFEAVPGRNSPWGLFATSTPPKDEVALTISRTVMDLEPFAMPLAYNG
nr:large capsid protein [Euprosterna elaeasa virus]